MVNTSVLSPDEEKSQPESDSKISLDCVGISSSHSYHGSTHTSQFPKPTIQKKSLLKTKVQPSLSVCNRREKYYFRRIVPSDRDVIQKLHEEWFPVKYKDDFYDSIVRTTRSNPYVSNDDDDGNEENVRTDPPSPRHSFSNIYSCVFAEREITDVKTTSIIANETPAATVNVSNSSFGGNNDIKNYDENNNHIMEPLIIPGIPNQEDTNLNCDSRYRKKEFNLDDLEKGHCLTIRQKIPSQTPNSIKIKSSLVPASPAEEQILGCLIGSYLRTVQISDEIRPLLIANPEKHPLLFYIMTLGTVSQQRHCGHGTRLIKHCLQMVESNENRQCGCVYLHVITYNEAAIRFYEKLGFRKVKEIEGYYTIDDKKYNCYLYAKPVNGNQIFLTRGARLLSFLSGVVSSVWKMFPFHMASTSFFASSPSLINSTK